MKKNLNITATHHGLHLEGAGLLVTWEELDRVRALLHTLVHEPLTPNGMNEVAATQYPGLKEKAAKYGSTQTTG